MCTILREVMAWRRGARGRKKAEWTGETRVYPERETEAVLPFQPLELLAPSKARWVPADAVANYFLGHVLVAVYQG
jgi:hypothetical protein